MAYYLVHPESACAWKVETREEVDACLDSDPLVMEVDYEEYLKACAAFGEEE